jgi:O-antigen/teichoic acid export membrane protein
LIKGSDPVTVGPEPSPSLDGLLHQALGTTGQKWILTMADQAIVSGATFLAGIIISRVCGKEQFGLYFLGLTIIGLIMEFQYVLIWSPYAVYSPHLNDRAHTLYTGSSLIHQLVMSILGMLALTMAGVCLSWSPGLRKLDSVIWMLVLSSSFFGFREYLRRVFFAGLRIKAALALDSCATFLQVGGVVLLAYLGKLSASTAFGVMSIGCGLATISWLIWARQGFALSIKQAMADLARNWVFGKWILGVHSATFLSLQIYPWLLTGLHGTEAVGVLAACQGVVGLSNPLLNGSCLFLEPMAAHAFAQGGVKRLRSFLIKSTMAIGGGMSLFAAIVITFGSQIVSFIYGPHYAGYGLVISVLALYSVVSAIHFAIYYGIWAVGRSDLNFKINLGRLAVTLTLGLWLVKNLGPLGVAWGFLLSSLAILWVEWLVFIMCCRSYENNVS